MTGYNVEPVVASETAVIEAIEKYYPHGARRRRAAASATAARRRGPSALEMASQGLEELQARSTRRRRRRGPRGARGDQRRGARQAGRGSAGRPARQRRADVGDPEGRERHPHRAVREGAARPLPHRRHPLQHHEPADEVPRRDRLARQDHGEARHRREAPAAGRPHQDPLQRRAAQPKEIDFRVSVPADALRREDRHASARQGQADARHDEARVRARVARQVRGGDPAAVGHGARHRADRQRQDQHALLVDLARSTRPKPTS